MWANEGTAAAAEAELQNPELEAELQQMYEQGLRELRNAERRTVLIQRVLAVLRLLRHTQNLEDLWQGLCDIVQTGIHRDRREAERRPAQRH